MKPISNISKSQYLKGLQCPLSLWNYHHKKDFKVEIDMATQHRFDVGHVVEEISHALYPGGDSVDAPHYDLATSLNQTKALLRVGKKVIYQAQALGANLYARIDILNKVEDGYELIEVKSGTKDKPEYIMDIAVQLFAFKNAGYDITSCKLIVVDNSYVKDGALDPHQFLKSIDVTEQAQQLQGEITHNVEYFINVVNNPTSPTCPIGTRCDKPYACDYKELCWKDVPEYSVFNVLSSAKLDKALSQGFMDPTKLPKKLMPSGYKKLDIEAHRSGKELVDKAALADWLALLKYPITYLDYETMGPAVPLYNGTKPYKHYPFQFSCHKESKSGKMDHAEFLHTEASDPREAFIQAVIAACGKKGSVVVYNIRFEKNINEQLAEDFPKYAKELLAINARMVDLMVPFQQRSLYHPDQLSFYKIKYVLPAFIKNKGYSDLDIKEGGTASLMYELAVQGKIENSEKVFDDLFAYCHMDTDAMVELVKVIQEYVSGKRGV